MRIRTLGKTGIRVGEVGFGAWAVGGPASLGPHQIGWGEKQDDTESIRAIEAAFEAGVNFFDTADVYGAGHSEELLGKIFAGRRAQVVLASKGGNLTAPDGSWQKDFSGEFLSARIEESLRRLNTDYLDLYQLHTPRSAEQMQQALGNAETLDRLVEQGKLRAYGISIGPLEDGLTQIEAGYGSAIQVVYNILDNEPEQKLLPAAKAANIGIIPRVPLAYGFLTGKYTAESTFDHKDHRSQTISPEQKLDWVSRADRLKPIAAELGIPMAQLALQYILANDAVSVVIPGARNEQQARQNAAAGTAQPLSAEVVAKIREAAG
ncbi:MAG: aldo/keto reductase [Candidatus Glassbacteria bacterium]|nr:aldo/keto reductase [Candidatus Glassbacteria bacterium]